MQKVAAEGSEDALSRWEIVNNTALTLTLSLGERGLAPPLPNQSASILPLGCVEDRGLQIHLCNPLQLPSRQNPPIPYNRAAIVISP